MTNRQLIIKAFSGDYEKELTKKQIKEITGISYYHNTDKHLGDVLSRMVKSKILKRVKKGVYSLYSSSNQISNQNRLF